MRRPTSVPTASSLSADTCTHSCSCSAATAQVLELHARPDHALRFARAEIADELVHNSPSRIHAGLVLGRCHAKLGQHSLSVAALESATQLADEGRYLVSSVMSVRARAATGMEAGGAGAAAGHWSEATGKQRLAEAVGRMVGGGAERAEERAVLGAALLP